MLLENSVYAKIREDNGNWDGVLREAQDVVRTKNTNLDRDAGTVSSARKEQISMA